MVLFYYFLNTRITNYHIKHQWLSIHVAFTCFFIFKFKFEFFSYFLIISLENEQLNQIVQCMEKKTAEPSMDIIVEGSVGERIYVLASGKVQILQSNRVIHTLR